MLQSSLWRVHASPAVTVPTISPSLPTLVPPKKTTEPVSKKMRATLEIASLGISAPLVWSTSYLEKDLQNDLVRGVSLFPGTALPGALGNALVAGHSSDFAWKPGNYKQIFAGLNDLAIGDDTTVITYVDTTGATTHQFRFRVLEKKIVTADDPQLFAQPTDRTELTLVTCWPLNTSWRRLLVRLAVVPPV